MIRFEYLRFLQTLTSEGVSADVRKVANLVLNHLDALIPLSTAQGQRIKKIVLLAQANWVTTSTDIQPVPQQTTTQACPFTQLKSLSVGPFRGFAKQEDFDLASQLVLIYGPNGTGKSSFCEALEFGLLGNVAEAESKRFRNQQDYLKNAHTNSFTTPALVGLDSQGNEIIISANEALYRFCFVEKNRIDNFSRIAAQAPAKQTELISTLFGLDAFTEFVRNFTDTIGVKYIDLEGVKAKELAKKREVLAGYQLQLKTTVPEEIQNIENEEKELAQEYREDSAFSDMVAELNGTEEKTGLIKQLEEELQKQLPQKSNVTDDNLEELKQSIETALNDLEAKQEQLSKASLQVSFKQLYEAVTRVQEGSPEQCPACQTPLAQVKVNPFVHADAELRKLEHLGLLQEGVKTLLDDIATSLNKLSTLINICCSRNQENNPLSAVQITDEKAATIDWWKSLLQNSDDGSTSLKHLEKQVKQLEDADKEIDKAEKMRVEKQAELNRLRGFTEKIVKLKTRTETANGTKKKAEEAIDKFDAENAQLIADADAEKAVVAQNQTIATAYAAFVQKLNAYKNGLPGQLVADLGERVVELYNAFNRNDAEHEKLASIRLPLSQNQRLEISFKKDSDKYFDALHILSEGHIRCVGLAILTAKNLKENCPILIFDDPVNAIDDEHRKAIRETLFVDDYFTGKQLIIAIHGEEFFNRTHQVIGKESAMNTHSYLFLAKQDHHIRVNFLNHPKNYVLAARAYYDSSEYRDSLMSARRALENLTEVAWYHYGKYCDKSDKPISVARRSPNQPWDLRYLADNLKAKFSKSKADIPNKDKVTSSLSIVLGTDAKQPPWTYLNKGTHDETDLPEFEQTVVYQIVTALEELDNALKEEKA
ncbi:MAG: AAA family ATPase [Thiomicrorhabdus sp.]|jgi:DNA sulfur modification protein DndD|nr:AAA family ATPase [Thiomicrorhabdus sp.]